MPIPSYRIAPALTVKSYRQSASAPRYGRSASPRTRWNCASGSTRPTGAHATRAKHQIHVSPNLPHEPRAGRGIRANSQIQVFANQPYEPRGAHATRAKHQIHVSPNLPHEPRAGRGVRAKPQRNPANDGMSDSAADRARHDVRRPPAGGTCPLLLQHVAGRRRRVETTDEHGQAGCGLVAPAPRGGVFHRRYPSSSVASNLSVFIRGFISQCPGSPVHNGRAKSGDSLGSPVCPAPNPQSTFSRIIPMNPETTRHPHKPPNPHFRVSTLQPRANRGAHANPRIHDFAYQPSCSEAGRGSHAKPQIHLFAYQPSLPAPASGVRHDAHDSAVPADLRLHRIAMEYRSRTNPGTRRANRPWNPPGPCPTIPRRWT